MEGEVPNHNCISGVFFNVLVFTVSDLTCASENSYFLIFNEKIGGLYQPKSVPDSAAQCQSRGGVFTMPAEFAKNISCASELFKFVSLWHNKLSMTAFYQSLYVNDPQALGFVTCKSKS